MNITNKLIEKVINGQDPFDVVANTLFEGWKKTSAGYEGIFSDHKAIVKKKGKKWFLFFMGKDYQMPRRPSFDHAEGIIKQDLSKIK